MSLFHRQESRQGTCCVTNSSLGRHASLVTAGCEALLTTSPVKVRIDREVVRENSEQQWGGGARLTGMGSVRKLLINVVISEVPKLLTGTDQKVCGWLIC